MAIWTIVTRKKKHLIMLSLSFFMMSMTVQASVIDSLKHELRTIKDDSLKLVIIKDIFREYLRSNIDSAARYADRFMDLGEDRIYFQATAFNLKGQVHLHKGDQVSAIQFFEKGLFLAEKNNLKNVQANILNNLAYSYGALGNHPKEIECYQRTLALDKETGYEIGVLLDYRGIGTAYEKMEDYERALYYLNLSYTLAVNKLDDVRLAGIISSMGFSLIRVNEIDSGMTMLHRALDIYQNAPNQQLNEALMLSLTGESYADIKQYEKALEYLLEAYNLSKALDYTMGVRAAARGLTSIFIQLNELEKATFYLNEARELAIATKDDEGLGTVLQYQIQLEKAKGNFELALALSSDLAILKDSIYSRERIMRIGALEVENRFIQEKDSLTYAQEKEVLAYKAKQSEDALIRNAIITILVITIIFLVNYYRLYKKRRQQSEALASANEKIQCQNKVIMEKKEDLERTLGELRSTQDLLVQNEKLAALGVLASGVGHEINNPLNFIKKGLELIETKMSKNDIELTLFRRDLNVVNDGISRISKIVSGLRGYSRHDDGFDQRCDLISILDNCIEIVRSSKRDVMIQKSYGIHELPMTGNEGRLHQVFLNFLMNAAQAIEGKGEIDVRVTMKNQLSEIRITDSGIGMSKEVLKKLGEPFFTTKPPGEGTGLGLYLSFDIIRQHEGTWHVDSAEGKGTTFTIYFPNIHQ